MFRDLLGENFTEYKTEISTRYIVIDLVFPCLYVLPHENLMVGSVFLVSTCDFNSKRFAYTTMDGKLKNAHPYIEKNNLWKFSYCHKHVFIYNYIAATLRCAYIGLMFKNCGSYADVICAIHPSFYVQNVQAIYGFKSDHVWFYRRSGEKRKLTQPHEPTVLSQNTTFWSYHLVDPLHFGHATTAGCSGSSRVCWCLCGRRASKGCWFFVSDRYHGDFVQEKETIIEGYEWQHPGARANNNNTVFICFQKSVWGWASRFSQLDFFPKELTIEGVTGSDGLFSRGWALFGPCVQGSDFTILHNP